MYEKLMQRILPGYELEIDSVEASGDEEAGYRLDLELTGFDSPSELVEFYNSTVKQGMEKPDTNFGSSESSTERLKDMNTSSAYSDGEWAVDAWEVVRKFAAGEEESYENALDAISTVTVAAVALSEGAEPNRGGYGFYRELAEYPNRPTVDEGPIMIDIEESTAEAPEDIDEDTAEEFPSRELEPESSQSSEELEPETTIEEPDETSPVEPEEPEIEEQLPYGSDLLEEEWFQRMEDMSVDEIMEQVHDEMVSGTIPEAKESIESVENPDYSSILEAEKRGKDRVTFKSYLEEKMEEEN